MHEMACIPETTENDAKDEIRGIKNTFLLQLCGEHRATKLLWVYG